MKTMEEVATAFVSNPAGFSERYRSLIDEAAVNPQVLMTAMALRDSSTLSVSLQIVQALSIGICIGIEMEKGNDDTK